MSSGAALWAFDGNTLSDARLDVAPDGYAPRRAPDPGTEGDGAIGLRYDRWRFINRQVDVGNTAQTGVNWTHVQLRLQQEVANNPGQGSRVVTSAVSFSGLSYFGGVLLNDGRVFCVPYNSTTARIYDPRTDTVVTPSGTYPGSASFEGGVLLNDGRVFCVPSNSTTARIYNPFTNTLITPSGTYPGGNAYGDGVLLPDGRVFCCPGNATTARIYDPRTDTLTTPSGTYPGSLGHNRCALLPDGCVYIFCRRSTAARIYNPVTDTLTTPTGTFPSGGGDNFISGTLLQDGRVFCNPYNSTTCRIYNPALDTLTTPAASSFGQSHGCHVLSDGRVGFYNRANAYNVARDLVETVSGTFPGGTAILSSRQMADGRVFLVPFSSATASIVGPIGGAVLSHQLSPYFKTE